MKNKVYYGEYSLKHWIELMLKEKIILPPYQRRFVWKAESVKELIKAFNDSQFVPPVTIGAFTIDGKSENLILDGQQRLTSILLAHLGKFPNKEKWEELIEQFANEDDEERDEEQPDKELKWKFQELTKLGRSRDVILSKIGEEYDPLDVEITIDDPFLNENFLGFSYLVPAETSDENAQQEYYSTVFRHINIQGVNLSPQESRAALYFLNKNLVKFFEPDFEYSGSIFFNRFKLNNEELLDFVRYLALLSQYHKNGGHWSIAAGYGNKIRREEYYEKYIHSAVNDEDSVSFGKFSEVFPDDNNYHTRFESLRQALQGLELPQAYPSIINMDIYFFGLMYEVIFERKTIDVSRKNELKEELENAIREFRETNDDADKHTRAPAALKYLRPRIAKSIEIYKRYVE